MSRFAPAALLLLLTACGGQKSESDALVDAANQSDPAAAAVLNEAAENGMNAQAALEVAGEAAATKADSGPPSGSLSARPNLPQSPNRPEGGEPPDKIVTSGNNAQQ